MEETNRNRSIDELINKLNYKYQYVKNNKYWDYNQIYHLLLNGHIYEVSENDVLLKTSYNIANNVDKNFIKENSNKDYEIFNIDLEQMKKIVISFFMNINPEFKDKIKFVLSHTQFIKYDNNISEDKQRSLTNENGIKFYYKNDLNSLITLAHEVSHGISNLDSHCSINNRHKVNAFSEIESELTEELFLEYLKNINLQIYDKNQNETVKNLDDNDIEHIKYNKYKSVAFLSYRAIDELEFKNFMKQNKKYNIDNNLIHDLSISMNISKEKVISKIERFIHEYYPGDNFVHDYTGIQNYDLKNGKHLSNESRFIYAYCFVEKFNEMNLDDHQKCEFYKYYLENAKNMSFQEVLKLFHVDLNNINSFSNEFIHKFNDLSSKISNVQQIGPMI